jgi:hypothetical protein
MTSLQPICGPQLWTPPGAPPRYATPRNPARYSEGDQVGVVARTLGTPLIPWQTHVSFVAGERRDDGSYEYEIVVVTVPRQTGKTTLLRAVGTQRALAGRDVFYTAQTGKAARARWADLVQILQMNPALKRRIKVALRGGSEHILFPSGAVFQCFAPTPESLHSYTIPTVMVDEAFAQTAGRGELLMGAIGPTQFTIVDKQIWIVSTAGTAESEWFHDWVERGREGADRVALFDWGATSEQNPYSLDDIAAFHPGVGFKLGEKSLTAQDVLDELGKNSRAEYERAFANRRTLTLSHLIPTETWRALEAKGTTAPADLSECVLAYDVAFDRQSAAIVALWRLDDGKPVGMVVHHRPGTSWLVDQVDELARTWRPRTLAAVDNGPVLDTTQALQALGHDPQLLGERGYATACSAFLARVDDEAISWASTSPEGASVLERSVTGLVTRSAASDGVAFSRRHSVGDSSPAIAFTAGLAVLENAPAGRVEIYTG